MTAKHRRTVRSTREYAFLKDYLERHPEMHRGALNLRAAEDVASSEYPELDATSEMWCWRVLNIYGVNQ